MSDFPTKSFLIIIRLIFIHCWNTYIVCYMSWAASLPCASNESVCSALVVKHSGASCSFV